MSLRKNMATYAVLLIVVKTIQDPSSVIRVHTYIYANQHIFHIYAICKTATAERKFKYAYLVVPYKGVL